MTKVKTIGISTGGGDCPGLNAVIRAAVKSAVLKHNWKVIGIQDGFDGLIWPEKSRELQLKDVSGILPRGGLSSVPPIAATRFTTKCPTVRSEHLRQDS